MKTAILYTTSQARWKLAGMTLLERAVLSAKREGYRNFIVINEDSDVTLFKWLSQRQRRWRLKFEIVSKEEFEREPHKFSHDLILRTDELRIGHDIHKVESRQDLKRANRVLYESLYEMSKKFNDGFILRYINRKLSRWVTSLLVWTPLTPNQISFSVLVVGFISAWFISRGTYADIVLGGLLFQLSSVLDCCDGEVAKLKYAWSRKGQWIDTICDNISYLAFLIGVFFGIVRQGIFPYPGLLTLIMLVGLVISLSYMFYYLLRYTQSGSLITVAKALFRDLEDQSQYFLIRLITKIKFMIKRDFFAFLFMMLCLANQLEWILVLATIGTNLTWIVFVTMKREFASQKSPAFQEE